MGISRNRKFGDWFFTAGVSTKAALLILLLCATPLSATENPETVPDVAGVTEKLGAQINLERMFTDQTGAAVSFGKTLIPGKPAILLPVYYRCPRLCKLNRSGAVELIKDLKLQLGKDITVISASFNPVETFKDAQNEMQMTATQIDADLSAPRTWSFLTGSPENSKALMDEIGFRFQKDGDEFSHPATLIIVTPEGHISRYFYDLKHNPQDVRLSLVEASHGGIGSTIDHILLFCFRFDPTRGKYSLLVMNVVRIVSLGIAAILFGLLAYMRIRELRVNARGKHV